MTVSVPVGDGIYAGIADSTYHADRGSLSFSGAKMLIPPSCPAKFRQYMDNPPPPKPEYTFGHVVHRLVLGEGAEIVEVDAPDWRSKDAQAIRATACNGIAPILSKDLAVAIAMAEAVHADPVAGPLFAEGEAEMSLYANDPSTGIRLRGRADWLTNDAHGQLIIVDYKTSTTAEPSQFARKTAEYRYVMQAPWYMDLVIAAELDEAPIFRFVVQEKYAPYLVQVMEFDTESIQEGRRLNRQAIDTYARCLETDTWPGYSNSIQTISLPPWGFSAEEIEV